MIYYNITFVIFVAFMNCNVMFFQGSSLSKWFSTIFALMTLLFFMYVIDMRFQVWVRLTQMITMVTFVGSFSFMNTFDMSFKIIFFLKSFATLVTFKRINFVYLMNFQMFGQVATIDKFFATNLTFIGIGMNFFLGSTSFFLLIIIRMPL